jgi:hypothetical protein
LLLLDPGWKKIRIQDKNLGSATLPVCTVGPPYLPVGETIVGGLGGHVREVDPLPEHVASGGRLRRGNLQTLNIDSDIIYNNATNS